MATESHDTDTEDRHETTSLPDITRRQMLQGAAAAGVLGMLTGAASAQEGPTVSGGLHSGRYIVGLTQSQPGAAAARSRADTVHRELDFGSIGRAVVADFSKQALSALATRNDVRYIEEDGVLHGTGQTLPWGIDRVDAEKVHARGQTGAGADIAIIDSGIDKDHPDLEAHLGTGKSFVDYTDEWDDDLDHGTHCAGIAGAIDNTEGVVGVAPGATLHAVKVLTNQNFGYWSWVAAGVKWTADQGYGVGSMSIGKHGPERGYSHILEDACLYAYDRGVLLVAAAGNDYGGQVDYPASYSTVMAVSSTTKNDDLSAFSNVGPQIELAAPGSAIYSTLPLDLSDDGYGSKWGTSMACPHVSGAGAQLMALGFSNTEARDRLNATAEDIGLPKNQQGNGLLDVEAAVPDPEAIAECGTVSAAQPDMGTWHTVTLDNSYENPAVVMGPVSNGGPHPIHTRVRNVQSDSFEFQLEEWAYLTDDFHRTETAHYVVMETGTHTLQDGTTVEAGTVETDLGFTSVDFVGAFDTTPAVLTQAQTVNGPQQIITRQRAASPDGFDVRLQEEEAREGFHRDETVGYIALEPNTGTTNGISYEVDSTGDTVGSDGKRISFTQDAGTDPVFLARMQSFDGPNTAQLRYGDLNATGVNVVVEEERSADSEVWHQSETVGYVTFSGAGTLVERPAIGETGTVTVSQSGPGEWHTVTLDGSYSNPVVVMGPLSHNGPHPCHPRLRNVQSDSFEFQIEEWDYLDGWHRSETAHYVVMERGIHTLSDGSTISAASVGVGDSFELVHYDGLFEKRPISLITPQTFNGHHAVVPRQRNVQKDSLEWCIQEQESKGLYHQSEIMGIINMEPGVSEVAGTTFEARRTPNAVTDEWFEIGFGGTYTNPVFVAAIETADGWQPCELRYRNLTGSSVEVFVEEEQSADRETYHTSERVDFMVFEGGQSASGTAADGSSGRMFYGTTESETAGFTDTNES